MADTTPELPKVTLQGEASVSYDVKSIELDATPKITLVAEGMITYPPETGIPPQPFVLRAGVPEQDERPSVDGGRTP